MPLYDYIEDWPSDSMKINLIFHQAWWCCSVAKQWSWKHDDFVLMKQPKQNKKTCCTRWDGGRRVCVCARSPYSLACFIASEPISFGARDSFEPIRTTHVNEIMSCHEKHARTQTNTHTHTHTPTGGWWFVLAYIDFKVFKTESDHYIRWQRKTPGPL